MKGKKGKKEIITINYDDMKFELVFQGKKQSGFPFDVIILVKIRYGKMWYLITLVLF